VTAQFGAKDVIPLDLLPEWVAESFRAIAPKRILARIENKESIGPEMSAAVRTAPRQKHKKSRVRK
jgi:hypothetical protein